MTLTNIPQTPSWQVWLMAIRPKTLPAAVAPILVGMALAVNDSVFSLLPTLAAMAGALLIQIGANLANDYYDCIKGADTAERTGPTRVAASGLVSLKQLRLAIGLTFSAAALVGLYLVIVGGWPILLLGLASIVAAVTYTGGPLPTGYHGLGDLLVFLFFGLGAVCGTYFVQAHALNLQVVIASVPVGTLTVAILVVNNLRDIESDRKTGKQTLAVILGPAATRLEYVLLLLAAYTVPGLFWLADWSSVWVLLPFLTLPLAFRLLRTTHQASEGSQLNRALAGTANLDLGFSFLFALGLVL
jgi:1,4-dihydroxy-2-naphthoate octaprenyltransferase